MAIFASNLAPASTDRALGSAVIERSLRFNNFSNSQDDATLTRTVGTTSNRRTFTHSFWVKRSRLGGNMVFGHTDDAGSYFFNFVFNGNDKIEFNEYRYNESPSNKIRLITTRLFRDVTSWYHIVTAVDTTQATAANRVKIYVNGVQETDFDTEIYCDQNHDTYFNSTSPYPIMRIGLNGWGYTGLNGYLAEFNAVDGYAYDPSYFGFTDSQTGNWMPKRYEGTYGTNGYRLDFSDNSSTSALGIDKSPNGNDFTLTNFSVSAGTGNDSLEDTPTNNFPILSQLNSIVNSNTFPAEIREAGLLMTGGDCHAAATFHLPKSGKWYAEFAKYGNGAPQAISVTRAHKEPYSYDGNLGVADMVQYVSNGEIGNRTRGSTSDAPTWQNDADIIVAMAVDMDNGAVYFARANTWINSGVPTSGSAKTGAIATDLLTDNDGEHYIGVQGYNGNNNYGMYVNFGQRPFTYTPPTGYKKLCAKNLPPNVPSIVRPQRFFDNLLYSGNGSTQSITGFEFKPDFVWIKMRSHDGDNHHLYDSVRGAAKSIFANTDDDEQTSDTDRLSSFDISGFTLGNNYRVNGSGKTFVAWCWKAGGAAVSNSDGAITSSVSVNDEAGFSIVSYSGNGNSTATIGHGLSKAPKWILIKCRSTDTQANWVVWHESLSDNKNVFLDQNNAEVTPSYGHITDPTSTLINVSKGSGNQTNASGQTYISYCWYEVPGYSKFGSYEANGDSNGPYVHCGFRPALIFIKNISLGQPWVLMDNKINPYNLADTRLSTSNSDGDHTSGDNYIDFLADGFKVRSGSSTDINYSTSYPNHIYMAFAEIPSATPFDMFPNAR
jgi:hypothetical protein